MIKYSKEWILYKIFENDYFIIYRCIAFTITNAWKSKIGYHKWYYDGDIYTFSFYWFGFSLYEREEEKQKYDFNFN